MPDICTYRLPATAPVALIDRLAAHLRAAGQPLHITALAAALDTSAGYVRILCRDLTRRGCLRRTATGTYVHTLLAEES
jgi:DNA-binding GntR family transcriptional regulator